MIVPLRWLVWVVQQSRCDEHPSTHLLHGESAALDPTANRVGADAERLSGVSDTHELGQSLGTHAIRVARDGTSVAG